MNGVREENLLGGQKVIVGKITEDLILETLGKVYIRNGRNFTLLNDIIQKVEELYSGIDSGTVEIGSSVYFIENLDEMGEYPDGSLVFDKQTEYLYMIVDGQPILLVEAKTNNSDKYVKRSGDTMEGQLILMYDGGPSLKVESKALVPNLNADRLDNYHVAELAIKAKDEIISGNWTHNGRTTFNNQVILNNNVSQQGGGYYTNNYIGTKQFIPGFQGVGWCVQPDDTGYTLTVDNLVVRKAMEVFELIVNKINATNGSMWISDYAKVFEAKRVEIVQTDVPVTLENNWFVKYTAKEKDKSYRIVKINKSHLSNSLEMKGTTDEDNTDVNFEEIDYIVFTKVFYSSNPTNPAAGSIQEFDLFEYLDTITGINENGELDEVSILAKFKIAPESYVDRQGMLQPNVSLINNKYIYKYDADVWTYYRYFGVTLENLKQAITVNNRLPGLYMVEFESEDCIPTLWEGDLGRCQKFHEGGIRYYDAMIGKSITTKLTDSENFFLPLFTITGNTMGNTEVYYDEENNTTIRKQHTELPKEPEIIRDSDGKIVEIKKDTSALIELMKRGDVVVRVGNVFNPRRQGAIYLTSSEHFSPYLNMISEVNRPDYTVLYYQPKYKKFSALAQMDRTGLSSFEGDANVMKYQTYYLQTNDFAVEYTKPKFRDLYAKYTTQQLLGASSMKTDNDQVDEFEEHSTYLTNSATSNTRYSEDGVPIGINYTPIKRYLFISSKDEEPYINPQEFTDSRETTSFKGITYCIGSI